MRLLKIAVVALAFTFGGCANIVPAFDVLTGSVATSAPVTTAQAEKVLTVAHLALKAAGQDIIAAAQAGTLHGTNATLVKTWYDKADDTLKAADQLDAVANAQGVVDKVAAVNTLLTDIHAIVPGK